MTIKNSGYVPNDISRLYSSSSSNRKLDQTTAVQSKTTVEDLNKNSSSSTSKVDTIELSKSQSSNRTSLSQTRDQIISDLNKDSDVSFLETLKTQISSDQYKVDPQKMAEIMLIENK
jgi:anti-sigma28 factor (negative regulator of flagellin synthesis)